MSNQSVAFDRAAEYYDRTRGFPEGVEKDVAALMARTGSLTSASRVLEIGVGTGRIALPVSAHVGVYVGIDLARPMMDKLRAKQTSELVYPVQGDATHLPFASAAFDAVIAVHVFHLIPAWRDVLVEVARVLRPGALLIHGWNGRLVVDKLQAIWQQATDETHAAQGAIPHWERETFLTNNGWREATPIQTHSFTIQRAPQDFLDSIEQRVFSSIWRMSDEQVARGVTAVKTYIADQHLDPKQPIAVEGSFNIQAYLPPENTLNILHLTPYYAPAYPFGGVTRAVEGMARALAARGHSVTVLTTDALSPTERYSGALDTLQDGVRVVRVRNLWRRGQLNLSIPLGMGHIARDLLADADMLHVHEFRTAENLLVTPTTAKLGIPIALSPHGTLTLTTGRGALKSVWDRLLSPAVARRIAAVIGLTAQEAAEARAVWESFGISDSTQFAVVPNGINPDEFTNLPGRESFRARYGLGDALVCLFMGRLHARKGVDLLARAFQTANIPDARLVIAGPDEGMLSVLQSLLDDRIIITGYLAGADRLAALAAADIFCLPATGEGLSMAALEALAAGLPVILSPGCNLPEAADYGAGVIVEPEVEPLAAALRNLLTSADRVRMSDAARRLVRDQFTWDSVSTQLEAVYRAMIGSKFNIP